MKCNYEALDTQGITVKGEIEGKDQRECVRKIRDKDLFPTKIISMEEPKQPKLSLMEMFIDTIRNVWNK